MSDKTYTLTVYLAAPGTAVIDKNTGEIKYSLPGHAYYAVSDGTSKQGFGFAPTKDSLLARMIGPGGVQPDEYKKYQNPHYERTMEITQAQYQALSDFGKNPQQVAGFNQYHYNFATNSCVDFTFSALKHAGIYKGRQTSFHDEYGEEYSYLNTGYEGLLKVLPNKRELEKIPAPVPDSPLNRTIERPLPPQDRLQKLLSENRQQDLNPGQPQYAHMQNGQPGIQTAPAADKFDLLAQTNHLIAQLQAGNPRALAEFTAQPEIQAAAQEARAEAQMLLRQNPHLADGLLPNRFNRPEFSDMPPQVQKLYAEGKEKLQGYYQEHGIRYGEEALENTAMALAAEGYRNRMRSVTMIVLKDGQVHIGDDTAPDFRRASVDAKEAGLTAGHESMARAQETEQEFARQAQQREMERMAESRSRGMSIG